MPLYLGLTSIDPSYVPEQGRRQREGGPYVDPKLAQMVTELPGKLPPTCRYVCAYTAGGIRMDGVPVISVIVLEAADTADLAFWERYYAGYLTVQWVPTSSVGATTSEREQAMAPNVAGARS